MSTITISGENRSENCTKHRKACRGIVLENGNILLTYEVNADQWSVPGGGLEGTESEAECCARELAEETGVRVKPVKKFLTVNEYYEEYLYESCYFICEAIGTVSRSLTEREKATGLEPRWIRLEAAVEIFSKHQSYSENEEKRGIYLREYRALCEYLNLLSK